MMTNGRGYISTNHCPTYVFSHLPPLSSPSYTPLNERYSPNAPIVITAVDKVAEVVTLRNAGTAAVDLAG